MRLDIVDGFRGFFLVNMLIVHMNWVIGANLFRHTFHELGYVEDAQGFVFLSGLVVGLAFGKILLRSGREAVWSKILTRTRTVYLYHALMVIVITIWVVNVAENPGAVYAGFGDLPWLFMTLSLLLINGAAIIDILPMYIFYLLLTPIALIQLAKGRYLEVIAVSVALWLLAQTGATLLAIKATEELTGVNEHGIWLTIGFSRSAWQIIYVGGLVIGMLMAQKKLNLDFMEERLGRLLFWLSLGFVVLFALSHQFFIHGWGEAPNSAFTERALYDRWVLSPLRLVNFAADVYLVSWLVIKGHLMRVTRWIGAAIRWVMALRPLVYLGQHSLPVYSFHVILFYAAKIHIQPNIQMISQEGRATIVIAALLLLFVPAKLDEWWRAAKKRRLANASAA